MSFENTEVEVSEKLIKFTEAHQEAERTRNELGQLLGGHIGCRINVKGYPATIFSEDKKSKCVLVRAIFCRLA